MIFKLYYQFPFCYRGVWHSNWITSSSITNLQFYTGGVWYFNVITKPPSSTWSISYLDGIANPLGNQKRILLCFINFKCRKYSCDLFIPPSMVHFPLKCTVTFRVVFLMKILIKKLTEFEWKIETVININICMYNRETIFIKSFNGDIPSLLCCSASWTVFKIFVLTQNEIFCLSIHLCVCLSTNP